MGLESGSGENFNLVDVLDNSLQELTISLLPSGRILRIHFGEQHVLDLEIDNSKPYVYVFEGAAVDCKETI
jgi:hypothetical protein